VSCTKLKAAHAAPARNLYLASDWFSKARAYVDSLDAEWFILSAEHGLTHPDTVIEPYDTTLCRMAKPARLTWAVNVWGQLVHEGLNVRPAVMLAGELYRDNLERWFTRNGAEPDWCRVPMRGLGLGEQKAWLAAHTTARPSPMFDWAGGSEGGGL
jgi:hypothetical protein